MNSQMDIIYTSFLLQVNMYLFNIIQYYRNALMCNRIPLGKSL